MSLLFAFPPRHLLNLYHLLLMDNTFTMESKLKKQRKLKTILPMAVMKINVPPNTEVNKCTPPVVAPFKHRASWKGWFPGPGKVAHTYDPSIQDKFQSYAGVCTRICFQIKQNTQRYFLEEIPILKMILIKRFSCTIYYEC